MKLVDVLTDPASGLYERAQRLWGVVPIDDEEEHRDHTLVVVLPSKLLGLAEAVFWRVSQYFHGRRSRHIHFQFHGVDVGFSASAGHWAWRGPVRFWFWYAYARFYHAGWPSMKEALPKPQLG